MKILRTPTELRATIAKSREKSKTIALIPTMGALHEGHLSLVRQGARKADITVVSIFVNPTQFAPHEDFADYPRQELQDFKLLESVNCDFVYVPKATDMYPEGFATSVKVEGITDMLCGKSRPHFFGGVATVVSKLLLQCLPDIALFGEKDYQQLMVIRRMVADLDIPVKILGCPILREKDGLAMSSRNRYLNAEDRKKASELYRTLQEIGRRNLTIQEAIDHLNASGFRVDYLECRHQETLALCKVSDKHARLFAAAFVGSTRLIDNLRAF